MKFGKGTSAPKTKDIVFEKPQNKYPKPKIILLDVDESAAKALADKGYNVSIGTLGKPYKVGKGDGYQPVIGTALLPNYTEQEIIVVDLYVDEHASGPVGEKHRPDGEPDLWAKCDRGFIDPRPRAAIRVRESFNRALGAGGIFIVFADSRNRIDMIVARKEGGRFGGLYDQQPFAGDVWNLIDEFADITIGDDHGREMRATDKSPLGKLLAQHLDGGQFTCTVDGGYRGEEPWVTLAENKFSEPVSICRCRGKDGTVIILPQIANKDRFLVNLFTSVLPALSPALFPHGDRGVWTRLPEYELPRILDLEREKQEVEQRAVAEVTRISEQIELERSENGWIHDLLTGTDAELVAATKKAFGLFGFEKVVDVDEERDKEGKSRREDLQIQDTSPTLIVDIKGIGNFPSDEDVLQAGKHAAIRMREWKRTDVVGLSIINHQRHIPPHDRDNAMPFRPELIDAALEMAIGLLTSWDVYRILKNVQMHQWPSDCIRPLFYRSGRIEVVPDHYEYLGFIAKAWTEKFGVVIEKGSLAVGDRIAVEFEVLFSEAVAESIYVKDTAVQTAKVGDPAGIPWPKGNMKLREGLRVFRIRG
jgi:hypothetical protein